MLVREVNVVTKKGGPGSLKIGLLYPSVYDVAITSLSYQMLYSVINSFDGFVAERFVLEERGGVVQPPRSIERGSRLDKMDVVLATVHYELDYVNMIRMIQASGVPALRSGRRPEEHPIIIVGGPSVTANPQPLANIADVILLGEVEPLLPRLLEALLEGKPKALEKLAGLEGFYVPLYNKGDKVRRVYAKTLDINYHPIAQVQPEGGGVWGRSLMVEAMRGCGRYCRFCMEGHVLLPKRDRPLAQIERVLSEGLKALNTNKATIYSLSLFDHKEVDRLLDLLIDMGVQASLPSLRLESLTYERLVKLVRLGQRTLTIAPETASKRLGRAILKCPLLKGLVDEKLREVTRSGVRNLKLYFMVGLPGESREEALDIPREVLRIKKEYNGIRRISVSVNPFMPKPGTPMQWMGFIGRGPALERIKSVLKPLASAGVRVGYYDPRLAEIQVVLSRGGPEVSEVLVKWGSMGRANYSTWRMALSMTGLNPSKYLGPLGLGSELPWDVVDYGVPARLLEGGYYKYWEELRTSS